jgi:hypothetical protein
MDDEIRCTNELINRYSGYGPLEDALPRLDGPPMGVWPAKTMVDTTAMAVPAAASFAVENLR